MKKIIYSTKSINLIALALTMLIFFCINFTINKNPQSFIQNNPETIELEKNEKQEEKKENTEHEEIEEENWYIEINSINLKAPIQETTEMEILNKSVGHFEETPQENGNIALAAHNRGYEKNYFENLKNIKMGDEIKYKHFEFEKSYIVDVIEKIKETNWKYLENTDENKITLITCVENEPDYRLCVQASEIKNNNKLPE